MQVFHLYNMLVVLIHLEQVQTLSIPCVMNIFLKAEKIFTLKILVEQEIVGVIIPIRLLILLMTPLFGQFKNTLDTQQTLGLLGGRKLNQMH